VAIAWGAKPPHKLCKASIRLLCIDAGHEHVCCVLGPCVGLSTHWVGNRTLPCLGRDCGHHDKPQTWKGFIPVQVYQWSHQGKANGEFTWVLVVTEEIGEDALTWTRGEVVTVGRPGTKKNGPLRFSKRLEPCRAELPPGFDVRPYVMRASGFSAGDCAKLKVFTGTDGR